MKRRGRGFAGDEADVNAGDEADVSGDVPRAKTRAASRDASPSDVPDWPEDGARVSDLARLGDDITPEKHAMTITRASDDDDGPAPYSNTSPEVLEVLERPRNALLYILSARARTTSPWWRRTARASRRFWKMRRSRARRARARRRFSPGSRTRRARLMPRRSHCERLFSKRNVSRRRSHYAGTQASKAAVALAADRVARRRPKRGAMRRSARLVENKKHAVAAAKRARRRHALRSARRVVRRWAAHAARRSWRRATRRDAVRGVAPTRATRRGARAWRGVVEESRSARARARGRGRRGEKARPRDKGRAGCARALAFMDARSGFGQSRYRAAYRSAARRLLSRRWRFGSRFGSPGIEKERARRRARRERHDGRCALPVRRRRRRRLRALAGRASDASRFGNVSRFVIH